MVAKKGFSSNMFHSKGFIILSHILRLLFFFSIPIIFLGSQFKAEELSVLFRSKPYWIFYGYYLFIFYANSYWLIPRLFLQKKYLSYAGIIILLFAGAYFIKPFDRLVTYKSRETPPNNSGLFPGQFKPSSGPPNLNMPPSFPETGAPAGSRPGGPPPPKNDPPGGGPPNQLVPVDIVSLFLVVMIVSLNLAVETAKQWRTTQKRALQAEADKANAELSFLKAQINPHFLFNTLNNIYSLVVTQSENAGPAILKLSNIMRYVTDDVSADYVPLQQEVDCIRDYIELQRLRLGKKVVLDFSVAGTFENKRIAPLILLTFIENVFKYGISNHENAPITINLSAETNKITFFCQNKIFPHKNKPERAGVGITNTTERLKFLYPDKHHLDINTENNLFTIQLTLLT